MIIEKDTILEIEHFRKGKMIVKAAQDFDTSETLFWPVIVAQEKPIKGIGDSEGLSMSTRWRFGDTIPCKRNLVRSWKVIEPQEESEDEHR